MFENDATEIAKLVKSINPKIIVILGGVTATIEEIYEPLLLNEHCYDIMCRGEGEKTFAELLENYNPSNGEIENLPEIKGISYTNNNMVFKNEDRPFVQDLDSLPFPALHLLDLDKTFNNKYYSRWRNNPIGKRCIPIFTSRGCPYQCCFCSVHSQVGYSFRAYSIDYVIRLMKLCIEKYNITHFHFEDDNLTFDMCRAKSLFRQMAKLNITWDTPNGVRADKIDEEMIQAKGVNLSLIKDDRLLIENFSYSLKPTDKTVIIGEEGNGKSTLLKFMYDDTLISSYASFTGNTFLFFSR